MKTVILEEIVYEVMVDYKSGYDKEAVEKLYTDYFKIYDYILGDWSYGRLRLKGFCTDKNPHHNQINDYDSIPEYLEKNCAYDCKHVILKKVGE